MKILVVGAGSIGIYVGALLHAQGHDVTLLGRKKLKTLSDKILIGKKAYSLPKKVYSFPKNKTYQVVFITSKLYDLQKNLKLILKNKIKTTYLVSIQNGMVEEDVYKPYLAHSSFAPISVFEGFRLVENKILIAHGKTGWKTEKSPSGKVIARMLKEAGIRCTTSSNIQRVKAEKTVMNCSVNILSAVEKKTLFELCTAPKTRRIVDNLFNESYAVLDKEVKMKPRWILKALFYSTLGRMKHYSSTYQDAISGRKSEIWFLNGLIVRLGKKYHLSTSENERVLKKFIGLYPKSK
ncbi:MAG: 2-dehydropantoate 2-reductase [Candidatus Nanoarchaeia archaeon]